MGSTATRGGPTTPDAPETPEARARAGAPPAEPSDLEQAILGEGIVFNALEVADETGATIDQARRLWRALGFPDRGSERAFTQADADAVSTLLRLVDGGVIDFDMAVNLTRAVGQTMARLADWEVATLVHRVQELEAGRRRHRVAGHDRAPDGRRAERAVRGAAGLRLEAPPGRGGEPGRGARRQRGGPPHDAGDRRLRRHRRLHRPDQPARPRPDRRPRRDLRVALRRRGGGPARPGDQEHRRRGAVRERGPDPRLRHRRGDHRGDRPRPADARRPRGAVHGVGRDASR